MTESVTLWNQWLVAADEADCHKELGREWEDGCCKNRRGRLMRVRVSLWLLLAEKGCFCWQDYSFFEEPELAK